MQSMILKGIRIDIRGKRLQKANFQVSDKSSLCVAIKNLKEQMIWFRFSNNK
jgi:hypothetical protein